MDLKTRIEASKITLSELDPDILVLTEHNTTEIELNKLKIEKCSRVSNFTRTTTSGGGVLILIREGLHGRQLVSPDIDALSEDKLFECCVTKFKIQNFSFILAGVYRKPQFKSREFLDRLRFLIGFLLSKAKFIIITGDFNIYLLEDSIYSNDFKNILNRYGMNTMVDFPTRVTQTCESCLDNFYY